MRIYGIVLEMSVIPNDISSFRTPFRHIIFEGKASPSVVRLHSLLRAHSQQNSVSGPSSSCLGSFLFFCFSWINSCQVQKPQKGRPTSENLTLSHNRVFSELPVQHKWILTLHVQQKRRRDCRAWMWLQWLRGWAAGSRHWEYSQEDHKTRGIPSEVCGNTNKDRKPNCWLLSCPFCARGQETHKWQKKPKWYWRAERVMGRRVVSSCAGPALSCSARDSMGDTATATPACQHGMWSWLNPVRRENSIVKDQERYHMKLSLFTLAKAWKPPHTPTIREWIRTAWQGQERVEQEIRSRPLLQPCFQFVAHYRVSWALTAKGLHLSTDP